MNILDIRVQKLFVVALVLKVLSSGLGWYFGSPWILGFAIPLIIMAGYIGLGLYRRDSDVSDDKFADSAYYLGFIFTITSIIFSLFDLPHIGTKIQDVAVRFGAAMVSTVLGLGVRVYLVSFRVDVADAMRDAEDALLSATQTFTERLTMSLERLQDFESRVDLAARSSVERVNMQIETMSKNHADKLTEFFTDLTIRNQEAFTVALDEVRGASSRLSESVDGYASGMKTHLGSIEARVTAFASAVTSRLQGTTFPDDYFAKRLADPLAQLEVAAGDIAQRVVGSSEEMFKTARMLADSLVAVRERTSQAETSMDSVVRLAGQQQLVLETAQGQLGTLAQLASKLEAFDTLLTNTIDALRIGHETNAALCAQVGKMVTEAVEGREAMARSLASVAEQLGQQATASTTLVGRIDATVAASERIVTQLGKSAAAQVSASAHLESSANHASQVAARYGASVEAEQASSRALVDLSARADRTLTKVDEAVQGLHEIVRLVSLLADSLRGPGVDQGPASGRHPNHNSEGHVQGIATTGAAGHQTRVPHATGPLLTSEQSGSATRFAILRPEIPAFRTLQPSTPVVSPTSGANESNGHVPSAPVPPAQG